MACDGPQRVLVNFLLPRLSSLIFLSFALAQMSSETGWLAGAAKETCWLAGTAKETGWPAGAATKTGWSGLPRALILVKAQCHAKAVAPIHFLHQISQFTYLLVWTVGLVFLLTCQQELLFMTCM